MSPEPVEDQSTVVAYFGDPRYLRKRISREIAKGFEATHCGPGASNTAGCVAGKVALEVGTSDALWGD